MHLTGIDRMARTGMYVLQGIVPSEIALAPFDVKVVDLYDDSGTPFTPAEVNLMGGGAGSALLLGYFSLGEAETYRDYFSSIPESAIGPENPQWAGNYQVAYWTQEWRDVATAYLDRAIAAGFDGIYFDVVDEYQQRWARNNAPGGAAGAEQAMADLVAYLADYAHAKAPDFQIWANNAEELLANDTYFTHLDGMFKENLFYTGGGVLQSLSETQASLELLQRMILAGKDVISIEYVSSVDDVEDVITKAVAADIGYYTADIELDGISYTGVQPGQIIHSDGVSPDLYLQGGSAVDLLIGREGSDTLEGRGGNDNLYGSAGNDRLRGGSGADAMLGGSGDDRYYVNNTRDTVYETATRAVGDHVDLGGRDIVYSTVTYSIAGSKPGRQFIEDLTLYGAAPVNATGNGLANRLTGNAAANILNGGSGKDILKGGSGNDTLIGGRGADTLAGGNGADAFRLGSLESVARADVIIDFVPGVDSLQILRAAFPGLADHAPGVLAENELALGTVAMTAEQHLVYDVATGRLFYDPDGVGGAGQVLIAVLDNHPALTADDIVLI